MNVRVARPNNPRSLSRTGRALVLGTQLLLFAATTTVEAREWRVTEAPLRFTFNLFTSPTHREAGYLAQIPDGGILPGNDPRAWVFTDDGTAVESYTLWHGVTAGLWIVFADPGRARSVDVYIGQDPSGNKWKPSTGLRPSPLLVTDPSAASLADAQRLARLGKVDARAHVQIKSGIRQAPLSVGGDDSGRPRPTSFYLQTYVATTDPGRTWIATFFQQGTNQVLIDGEPLKPSKQSEKWGGRGDWVRLDKGLHRVEILTASEPSGTYLDEKFRGHAYLAWRTPKMPASELGGAQSKDQPQPGAPTWAARVIENHEIVQSGTTRLLEATRQDKKPLAIASLEAKQNYWFEGEEQLAVYSFEAMQKGNPADTSYEWMFTDGTRVKEPSFLWLVPGLREQQVKLTAVSPQGRSSCAVSFFSFSTMKTSLANPQHRKMFREAMETMLRVYPVQPDPCLQWGAAYWNNLVRTAEYGEGYALLQSLFGRRPASAEKKLSAENLRVLEDIFLTAAALEEPAKALQWVRRFREAATDARRQAALGIREAEIRLIYFDQIDQAREILATIVRQGGEESERARIRIGDTYLREGDLDKATQVYAAAQETVRHQRQGAPRAGEQVLASWKLGAVKDAAHSEQVAMLIAESNYLEARQELDRWERDFPLSKLSDDLILREASLYMDLGDWKRARWLLEPYCRQVDASSYLPASAAALLRCLDEMNEPMKTIEETVSFLKERLKFHPVVEELESYLPNQLP